ncbi:CDGSH iron-sulfur domain-containing protein [Mariprofundus sp. NF]|uniref:CDGSH iron-sulfur domain-containing protein n=1 Tax=Mariprofundus sp. NF TaxID=2608716 RepID=UPI0019D5A8D8|nr:CDGSH iron-sulfur domain-containing protein [Mariprofundus sp. NF]
MSDKMTYDGKDISISFDGSKCIHSRNCVLGLPNVFQANVEGPWINPDNATSEEIFAIAHACPSGAITFERHNGGREETVPLVNTLHVRENGALAIHADLTIDGKKDGFRATLCRCGASKNKPYCDGSHHEVQFTASGEMPVKESEPLKDRDGEVGVTSLPDGPLQVEGNLEVCCGTGRTIERTQKAFFCRCGASGNKPYCDGSHVKIGFKG